MNRGPCVFLVLALLAPQAAWAQMQPHRAAYVLRLGAAANAPRIGTAVQDVTLDCKGWQIRRDVRSEIALTSSLKVNLASRLEGEEARDGNAFSYRATQSQNGAERHTRGKVQRADKETYAEIESPDGLARLALPLSTSMPVAGIDKLIEALVGKARSFSTTVFEAEATGGAYRVDVKELDPESIRALPPAIKPVTVPARKFWSISMTFVRAQEPQQKPLFSMRARLSDSGVLDRLTVDAGIAVITADLDALEMHAAPTCAAP